MQGEVVRSCSLIQGVLSFIFVSVAISAQGKMAQFVLPCK
jgi:hypothetical protein